MSLVFALDKVLDRVDNDLGLIEELLQMFFGECAELLTALSNSIASSDFASCEAQAHSLKGSFGNLGAEQCAQVALALETAAKNKMFAECSEHYARLVKEIDSFKREAFRAFPHLS